MNPTKSISLFSPVTALQVNSSLNPFFLAMGCENGTLQLRDENLLIQNSFELKESIQAILFSESHGLLIGSGKKIFLYDSRQAQPMLWADFPDEVNQVARIKKLKIRFPLITSITI